LLAEAEADKRRTIDFSYNHLGAPHRSGVKNRLEVNHNRSEKPMTLATDNEARSVEPLATTLSEPLASESMAQQKTERIIEPLTVSIKNRESVADQQAVTGYRAEADREAMKKQILEMSQAGIDTILIAKRFGLPKGEVELIISLWETRS